MVGGADNWNILASISRSDGVPPDPYSYVTDARIARSGFTIRCLQSAGNNSNENKWLKFLIFFGSVNVFYLLDYVTPTEIFQIGDCKKKKKKKLLGHFLL